MQHCYIKVQKTSFLSTQYRFEVIMFKKKIKKRNNTDFKGLFLNILHSYLHITCKLAHFNESGLGQQSFWR